MVYRPLPAPILWLPTRPVVFDPIVFPDATQWLQYDYKLNATGNCAISYSAFEALPTGLSIPADTLTGKPEAAGTFPLHITAEDIQGFYVTLPATLNIIAANKPVVAPFPAPVPCSGKNALLNLTDPVKNLITLNGGNIVAYTAQNLAINPPLTSANWTNIENLVTYTGTTDVNDPTGKTCIATGVTIDQGLTWSVPTFVNGLVGRDNPAVTIAPTGGVAPYTIITSGLPAGILAVTNGNGSG